MSARDFSKPLEADQPIPMAVKLHKFKPNRHATLVLTVLLCVLIMTILLNLDLEPARLPVMLSHPLGGASSDSLSSSSLVSREDNAVQSMGHGGTRTILTNNRLGKDPEGTAVDGTVAEKVHDAARNEVGTLVVNGRPDSLGPMQAPQNLSIVPVGNGTTESSPSYVEPIRNETMASDVQMSSHDMEKKHGRNTTIALVGNATMVSSSTKQAPQNLSISRVGDRTANETMASDVQKSSHDMEKKHGRNTTIALVGNATMDSSSTKQAPQNLSIGRVGDRITNETMAPDVQKSSHDMEKKHGRNTTIALLGNATMDSSSTKQAPQNLSIGRVGDRTAESSLHMQPIGNEKMVSDTEDRDTEKKQGQNAMIAHDVGNKTTDSSQDFQLPGHDAQPTQKETMASGQKEVALASSHTMQKQGQSTVIVLLVNKTMLVLNKTAQSFRDVRAPGNVTKLPATVAEQVFVNDRTKQSSPNVELIQEKNGTMVRAVQKQGVHSSHDTEKDGKNGMTLLVGNKTKDSSRDVQSQGNDVQPTTKETGVRVQKDETRESYENLQKHNRSTVVVPVAVNPADPSQDVQWPSNVTMLSPAPLTLNSSAGGSLAVLQQQIAKLVADGKMGRIIKISNETDISGGGGAAGKPPEGNGPRLIEPVNQDSNTSPPPQVVPTQTLIVPSQTVQTPPAVLDQPPMEFGHGIPPYVGTLEDYMISVDMGGDCVKGYECKFTFTTKLYYTAVAFNREVMVLLDGPELLVADIENTVHYRSWCASFWPWAAGAYNVQIRSDCAGILMSTSFSLVVHEPNVSAAVREQRPLASPCEKGTRGRWWRTPSGLYVWKIWEDCDSKRARPSNWVALLNARGIREINFVGDSHLRALSQHLRTLIEGGFSLAHVGYHGDIFHTIVGDNDTSLKLNFYWVDGIYLNKEFGCVNRGMFSGRQNEFPSNISQTADVLISNAAAWTWAYCILAKESYDKHFPEYVNWIKSALGPKTKWVWRSEAPFNGHVQGCSRRTNNGMRYANNLAREAAKKEGAEFFNAWNIEGPRFLENCNVYDPHYSCPYTFFGVAKMWGPIGEAVAIDFMHFLIYHLTQ